MADIVPFAFDGQPVRVVTRDGEPWFVLADIGRVLEHSNPRQLATILDDDEKGVILADTLGGAQSLSIISEAGLYRIVLRSDKPQAKPFQKWVTGTVLPSIRKHGGYIAGQETADPLDVLARAVLVAQSVIASRDARLAVVEPKAAALDRIEAAEGDLTLTAAAKVLKIGPKALIAYLSANRWIYRRHDDAPWVGHQPRVDAGALVHRVSSYTKSDGTEHVKEQVRVTPRGIAKLAALLTASEAEAA